MRSRLIAGGALGALALAALASPLAASASTADPARLAILHGIPGVPVDVWVNGERQLDDFQPAALAGPLELPAGSYSVAITAATAGSATEDVVIGPIDLPLAAGGNYTAVAHLTPDDTPTATLFTNDTSRTAAGEGRLTVRHTAGAPAVDVVVGGEAIVSNLSNPNEQSLDLAAATVSASVTATGTTEPALIGPADVSIAEGVNTIVYAYGSAADGTLALAVQTISGLHTPPSGIPAGQTGAAAAAGDLSAWFGYGVIALLLSGAAVLVVKRTSAERS